MGGDGRRVVHKSNPGTGGVGGDGDGFLLFSTVEDPGAPQESTGNLGVHSGFANPDYAGDWVAAGIDSVSFWLRDVNLEQDIELHFCIGRTGNIWQSNTGFHPPADHWARFSVDLRSATGFTQLFGEETFDQTLRNVDRILLRHDLAPFEVIPAAIRADVGLDQLTLHGNAMTATRSATWGRIKALYR